MTEFENYIDGHARPAAAGAVFETYNPSRIDERLGRFPDSTVVDVDAAVVAATRAFAAWRATPAPARGEILLEAGRLMAERKRELAAMVSRENGKTVAAALGDVQSGIDMARFAAGEGRRWYGRTTHSALPQRFAMTQRIPVGVVGVITSWNFPWAITCWKVLPALLCGNPVVLKSEEHCPESALRFAEILTQAGLPAGVLNVVHGRGPAAGVALTHHPGVAMIAFTGSSAVGRQVAQACAARLAKVSLELGGKNAVIVLEDADLDLAADAVVTGAFSLSGQRCTATSRVIVQQSVWPAFLERLITRSARLRVGPGWDDASEVTPLISRNQLERVLGYLARARATGARVCIGGERLKGGVYDQGYYVAPTILDQVDPASEIAREEVFGPVLAALPAASFADALRLHNAVPYGLSAALFTRSIDRAFQFFDAAEAGVLYINAPTFGSEPHLPFGGVKASGLGYREAGWAAIEAFSEVQGLYLDYSARVQNVQFATDSKEA